MLGNYVSGFTSHKLRRYTERGLNGVWNKYADNRDSHRSIDTASNQADDIDRKWPAADAVFVCTIRNESDDGTDIVHSFTDRSTCRTF